MVEESPEQRLVDLLLPQLGESVAEGTVTAWLKEPGEPVKVDEPLCEISTDKVNTQIPSPVSGEIAERVVGRGERVEVGTVLARISVRDSASSGPKEDSAREGSGAGETVPEDRLHFEDSRISLWGGPEEVNDGEPAGTPPGEEDPDEAEFPAPSGERPGEQETSSDAPKRLRERESHSPAVLALARKEGVVLQEVPGTGRDGRVTLEDLRRHLRTNPEDSALGKVDPEPDREAGGRGEGEWREPLSPVRHVIAKRLSESKATIPHCTTVMEVNLSTVARMRERERESFEARVGVPLTYVPFVAHASIRALEEHPGMNAVLEGDEIRFRREVHLGIAVATEEGLVVPVIHGAEELSFSELTLHLADVAARARAGELGPEDVRGGTFTLTNHGRGGSLWGTLIIVPGQTGILGIGKIRRGPVVQDDTIRVGETCHLSLSFDHRTVDGAGANAFLRTVLQGLQALDPDVLRRG